MGKFFTVHAQERAKERYGLDLTPVDMLAILNACRVGKAFLGKVDHESKTFMLHFAGQTVVPVISLDLGLIITFMAPDRFVSGRNLEHFKKLGLAKQRSSVCRHPLKDGYRRERITIQQALDEA